MIGLAIDIVKWCYSRRKKRQEVYRVKETEEQINVNTIQQFDATHADIIIKKFNERMNRV